MFLWKVQLTVDDVTRTNLKADKVFQIFCKQTLHSTPSGKYIKYTSKHVHFYLFLLL